jgi:hypothetical protein
MPEEARIDARPVLVGALAVFVVAAALSIVGLVRLGGDSVSRHQDRANERAQVIGVAGQLAIDFTSIDYRKLDAEFTATAKHATPAFAKSYLATVRAFAPLYRRGKVVVTTSVDTAGIESLTPDAAVVLVALKGTATNTSSPNGSLQLFRMQVNLSRVNGNWLASNVQPI